MNTKISILKDEENQITIPNIWRDTFFEIVEVLKEGDFKIQRGITGVRPISEQDAIRIARTLDNYGARLTSLPEETWQTSVCQWMRGYWDVLVDLFTIEEGASDLVLAVRVYEGSSSYTFEIQSVYVP